MDVKNTSKVIYNYFFNSVYLKIQEIVFVVRLILLLLTSSLYFKEKSNKVRENVISFYKQETILIIIYTDSLTLLLR